MRNCRAWKSRILFISIVAIASSIASAAVAEERTPAPEVEVEDRVSDADDPSIVSNLSQTYAVRPGDTLFGIAVHLRIGIGELLAANPQLQNPNLLRVGQLLNLPTDSPPPDAPTVSVSPTTVEGAGPVTITVRGTNWDSDDGNMIFVRQCKIGSSTIDDELCTTVTTFTARSNFTFAWDMDMPRQGITLVVDQLYNNQNGETWYQFFTNIRVEIGVTNPYTVQPGDTVAGIAARFELSVTELLSYNPEIVNPNLIRVGQKIRVLPPGPTPPPAENKVYVVQVGDTLLSIAGAHGLSLGELRDLNPQLTRLALIFPGQVIVIRPGGVVPQVGVAG